MLAREYRALGHPHDHQSEDHRFHPGVRPRLHRAESERRREDQEEKTAGEDPVKPKGHGGWVLAVRFWVLGF